MGTFTMEQLRDRVRGAVITADDDGYDQARRVYNAMIDRRPRVVIRCANAGDVDSCSATTVSPRTRAMTVITVPVMLLRAQRPS